MLCCSTWCSIEGQQTPALSAGNVCICTHPCELPLDIEKSISLKVIRGKPVANYWSMEGYKYKSPCFNLRHTWWSLAALELSMGLTIAKITTTLPFSFFSPILLTSLFYRFIPSSFHNNKSLNRILHPHVIVNFMC